MSWVQLVRVALLLISLAGAAIRVPAEAGSAIDLSAAKRAFAEGEELSDRDGGRLWGRALYGPMLFVDPATHAVVANRGDAGGVLHPEDGVYTGMLPRTIPVANTSVEWLQTHWTMVIWPLPEDRQARERLMAHELFHRIQNDLQLPALNTANPQLDSREGRVWLQLEWRALAVALVARGAAQDMALADALAFRGERQRMFRGSEENERELEMNEGLAEYTGVAVSAPDVSSAVWRAVGRLTAPGGEGTFVRSFAYVSGPGYGLLLDERLPGWRKRIAARQDLAKMLAGTLKAGGALARVGLAEVSRRAQVYGGRALRGAETEREERTEAVRVRYRKLLVEGATVTLPVGERFNYGFDPNELTPLGDWGTVYPTMHASDAWGTLDVQQGALVDFNRKRVDVPAGEKTSGAHLTGPGWTLDLNPGWAVVPAERAGSFEVRKQ